MSHVPVTSSNFGRISARSANKYFLKKIRPKLELEDFLKSEPAHGDSTPFAHGAAAQL